MAVLVEPISNIIKLEAIKDRCPGGFRTSLIVLAGMLMLLTTSACSEAQIAMRVLNGASLLEQVPLNRMGTWDTPSYIGEEHNSPQAITKNQKAKIAED